MKNFRFSVLATPARQHRRCSTAAVACVVGLGLLLTIPAARAANHTKGRAVAPFVPSLKPGDYSWHPEISPSGPVVVFVSLPEQVLSVYRNGVWIGRSTVSTGKEGKRTPTGVFTVLQKKVDHTSSIYKGAKMPHMQRLTWSGVAMHAGELPGYPASAGCVRMPVDFAAKLYAVTGKGTTVIIADHRSAFSHTLRPGLLFSGKVGQPPQLSTPGSFTWNPQKAPTGPVSIVLSGRDREAYVYRNGVEIGRAAIVGDRMSRLSGTHAYSALSNLDAAGERDWVSTVSVGGKAPNLKKLAFHLVIPAAFLANVQPLIAPGTTLVLTDGPVSSRTHSAPGFDILTANSPPRGEVSE